MLRVLPLLLLVASPAAAAPFQDIVSLDRAVAGFTGRAIGEDGGARTAVDARLKLAQCPTVALAWRTPSQDAVTISCSGPDWRIFVPVKRAQAIAAVNAPIAVAAAIKPAIVIKRGDPIVIEAGSNGFSITREGVAMGDAVVGARVMVRIEDAKTPVQAVAVETGRATLPGWSE